MKYTAINIGVTEHPELSAKYENIEHYPLYKLVIDNWNKETPDIEVFSPSMVGGKSEKDKDKPCLEVMFDEDKTGVGLYPDRVYCKGAWGNFDSKRKEILQSFANSLGMEDCDAFKDYFNIMCATVDVEPDEKGFHETKAIRALNHLLDSLELNERATSGKSIDAIWSFITDEDKRQFLYKNAFKDEEFGRVFLNIAENGKLGRSIKATGYGTLAEYASVHLSTVNEERWKEARILGKFVDELKGKKHIYFQETQEDIFFRKLKDSFPNEIKSYHKYFCVVQADGDNMGKTFSHKELKDDETAEISSKLVEFGKNASGVIYEYGGLPIYAGGDDLLFLAPVVGKTKKNINISGNQTETYCKNIFDLLKDIDGCFEPVKSCVVGKNLLDDQKALIVPSMSYGVSITYYKFPLYEALESARNLLFEVAKNVDGKNAIAWRLQKNAGSSFEGAFSKDNLMDTFENVIQNSCVKESVVTAVSHKIRENQQLLQLWLKETESFTQRNLNFFKRYMDYDERNVYMASIIELINKLYEVYPLLFKEKDKEVDNDAKEGKIKILQTDKAQGIFTLEQKKDFLKQSLRDDLFKMVYSMIRTAKFINGEEVKDE